MGDWLQDWYLTGEVGASSETIARALTGERFGRGAPFAPLDASDVGRCVALLDLAAKNGEDWRARLPEVALRSYQWRLIVPRWPEIEAAYREDLARWNAAEKQAQQRYGATWRRRWRCPPSRCFQLLCQLRGDSDPYAGRSVPWATQQRKAPQLSETVEDVLGDDLSIRALNGLRNSGIVTLGDLTGKTSRELLAIRNFGRKCLSEVQEALYDLDLHLKESGRGK